MKSIETSDIICVLKVIIHHNMIIEYSNLNNERKIFLNKELADILYLCRRNQIPVPEINLLIIDSTDPTELPQEIKHRLKIRCMAGVEKPDNFTDLCEYEKNIQTSQSILNNNKLWIIGGGAEGAIYGFYNAVKKITGIRWYGTSESSVRFAKPAEIIEDIYRPELAFRGFEFSPSEEKHDFACRFLKWMVRNGWNLLDINASRWSVYPFRDEFIRMCNAFGIKLAIGCHAVELFVPDSLFETNPEFFGLREGKRCIKAIVSFPDINKKSESRIQPCYSNPKLRDIMTDAIVNFINNHPETYIFSLWPHDGINNWCQCDKCITKAPYEIMYNLALEITKKIKRFLPIELLCYSNMFLIPEKTLQFSNNTYTIFCPYLRRYEHRFFDDGFDEKKLTIGTRYPDPDPINPTDDREYGVLLNRWLPYLKKIGSTPGIFSYYQLVFHDETGKSDRSRYLYHPDYKIVEDEIKKFIELGVKVFYDCSPPYPNFWPDEKFYSYLSAILWEQHQSADEIIAEYYRAVAGERAEVLMNILKNISLSLKDRTNPEIPESLIRTAKGIFSNLTEPISNRYLLWIDYIQMGNDSWKALKNGDINKMIETENHIINFFKKNRAILEECIDVDYMIRYSKSVINFYQNKEDK